MRGFSFTAAIRLVCADMVQRLPELGHIDMQRVAIGVCQCRRDVEHGMYAALTPLRFAGGTREEVARGRRRSIEPLRDAAGREFLYLLSFYLPRFADTSLEFKLSTIVHELWHVGPLFDGDLRRFKGRCYAHGHSRKQYDVHMDELAQRWLALDPPDHLYAFLAHQFEQLAAEYGRVLGDRWTAPKVTLA